MADQSFLSDPVKPGGNKKPAPVADASGLPSTVPAVPPFRPEVLLPGGTLDKCLTALRYGADAVYLSGPEHSLRAAASGLDRTELETAVAEAKRRDASIYYCLNAYPREDDLPCLPKALEEAADAGVHGLIIADPGTFALARSVAPHLPIHVSTQANTANSASVAFWQEAGATRVNLARELDREEVAAVRAACPDMELEVFVHGAMCLAVSGQCLLSAWLNDRSANRGKCTQPCRFAYRALENKDCAAREERVLVDEAYRRGETVWEVGSVGDYGAVWAPDDLCLLPWLPLLTDMRLDALKVEGRMKSAAYVAHVADVYCSARDKAAAVTPVMDGRGSDMVGWLRELAVVASRPMSSGFFLRERQSVTLPAEPETILARVVEPLGTGLWKVLAQANWPDSADLRLVLPGMRRPVVDAGAYGLENHRAQRASILPCGVLGVLHCEHPDIEAGIFIRAVAEDDPGSASA